MLACWCWLFDFIPVGDLVICSEWQKWGQSQNLQPIFAFNICSDSTLTYTASTSWLTLTRMLFLHRFTGTQTYCPPKFSFSLDFGHLILKMLENVFFFYTFREKRYWNNQISGVDPYSFQKVWRSWPLQPQSVMSLPMSSQFLIGGTFEPPESFDHIHFSRKSWMHHSPHSLKIMKTLSQRCCELADCFLEDNVMWVESGSVCYSRYFFSYRSANFSPVNNWAIYPICSVFVTAYCSCVTLFLLLQTHATMSRSSNRKDGWVRIFEVPCFEKHEKGYTVYKIISRVSAKFI